MGRDFTYYCSDKREEEDRYEDSNFCMSISRHNDYIETDVYGKRELIFKLQFLINLLNNVSSGNIKTGEDGEKDISEALMVYSFCMKELTRKYIHIKYQ